jgi:hypothetical protein
MPKQNQPYTYRPDDDPITLAQRFNLPPNALIDANPGGYPFQTGQTINIPQTYEYRAPATTGPNVLVSPNSPTGSFLGGNPYDRTVNTGYSATGGATPSSPLDPRSRSTNMNQSLMDMRGRGYGQPDAADRINDMRGRGYGQTSALPTQTGYWQDPAGGTTPALAEGDFYGYERDPETGRSVRVIKNAATDNFLKELRWDPQARKYVSIARLLKQGKLDLKGNWNKTSKRQRRGAAQQRNRQQVEERQDYSLANSLITFSGSSG